MALSQGLLVGRLINRWGEERMIQVGLISNVVGYILFLFTFNMASIVGVMAIMGVASASLNPSVNSLASKRTPPDQQGRTMGIVGAYNSLGRIFGPVVGGALFDMLGYRSPYIFGSLLFLAIYLISIQLFADQRKRQAAQEQSHLPHLELSTVQTAGESGGLTRNLNAKRKKLNAKTLRGKDAKNNKRRFASPPCSFARLPLCAFALRFFAPLRSKPAAPAL